MQIATSLLPDCPEALLVNLARGGEREAFAELVRRRQSSIRNLMRRCCHQDALADDLAQQVFLQAWLKIRTLREANAFGGWLKRIAISIWLQHQRKNDALQNAEQIDLLEPQSRETPATGLDLDRALASLKGNEKLCVVLSYQEGMSHREIADAIAMPLGTVKSHITRGTQQLRHLLADYTEGKDKETSI